MKSPFLTFFNLLDTTNHKANTVDYNIISNHVAYFYIRRHQESASNLRKIGSGRKLFLLITS